MKEKVKYVCEDYQNPFDCADNLICFSKKLNAYGLIIHDGGNSFVEINFCPFCGTKIPIKND